MKLLVLFLALTLVSARREVRDWSPAHSTTIDSFPQPDGSVNTISKIGAAIRTRVQDPSVRFRDAANGPMDLLPKFEGAIVPNKPLAWKAGCFQMNNGTIQVTDQGVVATIITSSPKSVTCQDFVIFATASRWIFHDFVMRGSHKISFTGFKSKEELMDVKKNGLRVFTFDQGVLKTLLAIYEFYETFINIGSKTEAELIKFTHDFLKYDYVPRNNTFLKIPPEKVRAGDVLILHTTTPHETYDWYLTGSHSGHVALVLEHAGKLYVCETTDADWFPPPFGFHSTLWEEWLPFYSTRNYEVSWLRLRKDLSERFDSERAWKWFDSHRMKFDTPSFGFTAIDTVDDNVQPPLTGETAVLLMHMADSMAHATIQKMMIDGINMRFIKYFGHDYNCTNIQCAIDAAEDHDMSLPEVMALPEIDGWIYPTGPSIVCAGLVTNCLREGGALGNVQINAGEFHPRDVYMLKIYDDVWADRPEACKTSVPGRNYPWCQLSGKWVMDLPGFNTISPYDHMNEHCGAHAPDYVRFPATC